MHYKLQSPCSMKETIYKHKMLHKKRKYFKKIPAGQAGGYLFDRYSPCVVFCIKKVGRQPDLIIRPKLRFYSSIKYGLFQIKPKT